MKRDTGFVVFLAAWIAAAVLAGGCEKEYTENSNAIIVPDTIAPVVTIANDDMLHNWLKQYSAPGYTDPGATANDNKDGPVAVTVTGTVNMSSAGIYTLTYSATDSSGNTGSRNRTVIVDGGLFLSGNYSAEYFVGSTSMGVYPDTLKASSTAYNKIYFMRFADYLNGLVYATAADSTLTIPQQTVQCGYPPNYIDHTFSGSGTYSNITPLTFTINYTDVSTLGTVSGHIVYSLQ